VTTESAWESMKSSQKPSFVLCGEPQGGVLNVYVHGYSAFFSEQHLQTFAGELAAIEGSTNMLLFWPAGHFLEGLLAPLKGVIAALMSGNLMTLAVTTLRESFIYFLEHFKEIEERVDAIAENTLEALARDIESRQLHVERINLIGHSLGARLLVKSLLAAPEQASRLPLNNLLLMGGAICKTTPWDLVVKSLPGRLINCHSGKDWALAMKPDKEKCIGRHPISVPPALKEKVFNVNLDAFDHTQYWPNLKMVVDYTELLQIKRGLMLADRRSKDVRFAEEDGDLFPLLAKHATEEELKFLAELMTEKRSASIKATERDPHKLVIELQRMGGDSLMNLTRGHGVSYREFAQDAASKLGIRLAKDRDNDLAELEEQVAEKLIEQFKQKLSSADRQAFEEELKKAKEKEQDFFHRIGSSGSAAAMGGAVLVGLASFILQRGAVIAIPVVGQALGAVMMLVSGVTALSGPAYSVTTSAVLVIGLIRARAEREAAASEAQLVAMVEAALEMPIGGSAQIGRLGYEG